MLWGALIRRLAQRLFGSRQSETLQTIGGLSLEIKKAEFIFVRGETFMVFHTKWSAHNAWVNFYDADGVIMPHWSAAGLRWTPIDDQVMVWSTRPFDFDITVRVFA